MSKFYAVRQGRKTGIFTTWDECKKQIEGYSGAVFKSFKSRQEAQYYLEEDILQTKELKNIQKIEENVDENKLKKYDPKKYHNDENEVFASLVEDEMIAYIDGSYEHSKKCFAYAGIMFYNNKSEDFAYADNDQSLISMRNVSGEIKASIYVIQKALDYGLGKITIYYDYSGIEHWAKGDWKTNNELTEAYREFCMKMSKKIEINFVKVKSHTNIKFNEYVDKLAKNAIENAKF